MNEILSTSSKSVVFPESVVYCPRRVGARYMSVTSSKIGEPPNLVSLKFRAFEAPIHELSVCISPTYGDESKWLQIIEFVEHYRIQGATFFYFYLLEITEYDRKVLDFYERSGILETISMIDKFERPAHLYQLIQMQECHQRSKHHSKWVAFIDLDERLVTPGQNALNFLKTFDNSISDLQIMVQRVLKTGDLPQRFENVQKLEDEMIFKKYTNTTVPNWSAPKIIIRPEKVGVISIHYVAARYSGSRGIQVPPNQAIFRHYRNTKFRNFGENWENDYQNYSTTRLAAEFEEKLTDMVKQRAVEIYDRIPVDCGTISESSWKSRKMLNPCEKLPYSV